MSLQITKSFSHPLLLIAAALAIHIDGAVAAESAGDVQQQMRQVLAGTIATQSASPSAWRDARAVRPIGDAQDLARRLLLSVTGFRVQGTAAITRGEHAAAPGDASLRKGLLVHGDAQALAQRLLLGQRNAAAAGS
jgi:hypothetical protein